MNKLTILFKDGTVVEQENVVDHFCIEKMFYCELDNGSQHFITIDEIRSVQVNKVDDAVQLLSEKSHSSQTEQK